MDSPLEMREFTQQKESLTSPRLSSVGGTRTLESIPYLTTGFKFHACIYCDFLCVYSIFADLFLGSSFLYLWVTFSLPTFLFVTIHGLAFGLGKLDLFFPHSFFWLGMNAFSMLLVSENFLPLLKIILLMLYLSYIFITVWISGRDFGLGVEHTGQS